ncbi:MAG: hypothetical protein R3253_16960, partial [Longimicrobiales bacterium]|nr:hypothetical protein [Longimicrobiales bacterium]
MSSSSRSSSPRLVESLGAVSRRDPVGRKLLVAPNMAAGRELLRRLTLDGSGWVGFEVTTVSRLAHRLAEGGLERSQSTILDPFDHQALLDEALDSALTAEKAGLGELSEGVGFREKVHGAVNALRLAGITPKDLDGARFVQWQKKLFLLRVLQRYERLLAERRRADPATVLRLALSALDDAGNKLPPSLDADSIHLMPGLNTRGLAGRLIAELGARGGRVLETDPVVGLEAPGAVLWGKSGAPSPGSFLHAVEALEDGVDVLEVDLFHAASVDAELREVLRRIVEQGLRWDQVEIVTPDPAAYGSG